ncbi:MAG: outer membrane beta-barrel protein [Gammaproteobacteria bacterium]
MNKYLSTCVLICVAPSAFAKPGSGFYATIGVGGGFVDFQQITSFDIDYEHTINESNPSEAINEAFFNTVEYEYDSKTVLGGRAAIGYLWDIFEGEPTEFDGAIFTFNSTFGFELGYRLFDNVTSSFNQTSEDTLNSAPNPCTIPPDIVVTCTLDENAQSKTKLQAADLLAVIRLPFTTDSQFALLLKGGVAYNIYEVETSIDVEIDPDIIPAEPLPPGYNSTYTIDKQKHDEFLPVLAAGLEYMFNDNFGLSAEYNAIFASSHDANSQLISGNLVMRF